MKAEKTTTKELKVKIPVPVRSSEYLKWAYEGTIRDRVVERAKQLEAPAEIDLMIDEALTNGASIHYYDGPPIDGVVEVTLTLMWEEDKVQIEGE